MLRDEGGCQDSDDNAADFAAGTPAPRNAATAPSPCTGPQPPVAACGGPLAVVEGDPAERAVSATDPDGRVTDLALAVEPAADGIALTGATPAGAAGAPATGVVRVADAVPAGTYTATLTATNDDAAPETGSCTLAITVAPFDATPIGALQGSGLASPVHNQTRSIEGVVTGHDDEIGQSTSGAFPEDRGLYVQDAGDGDDATSDGIFVAEIVDPHMIEHFPLGTTVRVTGTVREKFDQTILDTNGSAAAIQARGARGRCRPGDARPRSRPRRRTGGDTAAAPTTSASRACACGWPRRPPTPAARTSSTSCSSRSASRRTACSAPTRRRT